LERKVRLVVLDRLDCKEFAVHKVQPEFKGQLEYRTHLELLALSGQPVVLAYLDPRGQWVRPVWQHVAKTESKAQLEWRVRLVRRGRRE